MRGALRDIIVRISLRRFLILTNDVVVVTAAFPISIYLRENFSPGPQHLLPALYGTCFLFFVSAFVFRIIGIQQTLWRYALPMDLFNLGKALSIVTGCFVPTMFLIDRLDGIPRSVLVIFWFVAFAGLCCTRIIYSSGVNAYVARLQRLTSHSPARVLVVGCVPTASAIIHALNTRFGNKTHIVGVVTEGAEGGRKLLGAEILGGAERFSSILASLEVTGCSPHAIVVGDTDHRTRTLLIRHPETMARDIAIFSSSFETELLQFIERRSVHSPLFFKALHHHHFSSKRLLDVVASSLALFLLSPIIVSIAFLLYVLSGTPIMFTQVRAGFHLREFHLLKFRTMRQPVDPNGRVLEDRERTTGFGKVLRFTRLDELPQFWNVLRGDMSLIGPRPLLHRDMPHEDDVLAERYSVRPGITGWAQVNGGHQVDADKKMSLDLYYIRHASFLMDVRIILMTMRMMIFGERIGHDAIRIAETIAVKP